MFLQNTWTNILCGVQTQNIIRVEEAAQRDMNVQAYWYRLHISLFMQGHFVNQTAGKQEGMLLTLSHHPSHGGGGMHAHPQTHKALISG
jgi:hypothetical protein